MGIKRIGSEIISNGFVRVYRKRLLTLLFSQKFKQWFYKGLQKKCMALLFYSVIALYITLFRVLLPYSFPSGVFTFAKTYQSFLFLQTAEKTLYSWLTPVGIGKFFLFYFMFQFLKRLDIFHIRLFGFKRFSSFVEFLIDVPDGFFHLRITYFPGSC